MSPVDQFEGQDYDVIDVLIASGGSLSAAVAVDAGEIVGISVPTIDAAGLTFQVAIAGTYRNLYNSDGTTETAVGSSTGDRVVQAPAALKEAGAVSVKVRSGTAGTPVNQTADRTIRLLLQRLMP